MENITLKVTYTDPSDNDQEIWTWEFYGIRFDNGKISVDIAVDAYQIEEVCPTYLPFQKLPTALILAFRALTAAQATPGSSDAKIWTESVATTAEQLGLGVTLEVFLTPTS